MVSMDGPQHLSVGSFDIKSACDKKFNALLVGKRNTGKSTVIQDILYYANKTNIPRVCVFSGTEEANGFYRQFVPTTFIYNDSCVEEQLTEILKSQKDLTKRKKWNLIPEDTDLRILIVLDDVGYKKGTLRSEVLRQIFMNGRHYSITMVLACQYIMDAPVDIRTNCDFVYVLKQTSCIENLHRTFFSGFDKKRDFKTVLDLCTQNYECLVLDNTKPTTDVSQVCFYYKAKLGRQFKFGSSALWNYHSKWNLSEEEKFMRDEKLKSCGAEVPKMIVKGFTASKKKRRY